jgi:ATPase subunit of ABC transporter with duplicated ATPase domains
MDEPSNYLDKDSKVCLELAIQKMKELSQTQDLQCLIITHEEVGYLFDHVEEFN